MGGVVCCVCVCVCACVCVGVCVCGRVCVCGCVCVGVGKLVWQAILGQKAPKAKLNKLNEYGASHTRKSVARDALQSSPSAEFSEKKTVMCIALYIYIHHIYRLSHGLLSVCGGDLGQPDVR
jgi:hypothetical protein